MMIFSNIQEYFASGLSMLKSFQMAHLEMSPGQDVYTKDISSYQEINQINCHYWFAVLVLIPVYLFVCLDTKRNR